MLHLVQESSSREVTWHPTALRISSELTSYFRRKYQKAAILVTPEGVVGALHEAGIKCVLLGTYGINGWRSEPRATQDVDVLVTKRDTRKAVKTIRKLYPELTVNDFPVVTRFVDPGTGLGVIDVMKPTHPLYRVAFRHTIQVEETHRLPSLELAIVSKFAAMVSPHRGQPKKLIDGGDFSDIIIFNRARIDLDKLVALANKVYPDGGNEILTHIVDIDAGRQIVF